MLKKYRSTGTIILKTMMVVRSSSLRYTFWLELLVCLIHPIPYFTIFDRYSVLMFLRLYLIFKLIRDYSEIYQKRHQIISTCYMYSVPPTFNWWFSLRALFYARPLILVTSIILVAGFVWGFCVYVWEREEPQNPFSFPVAVYMAFMALIVGWPSDPFGDYNPTSWATRVFLICSFFTGFLLLTILIGLMSNLLAPTHHQEIALGWLQSNYLDQKERNIAASYIQHVWRFYLWRKRAKRRWSESVSKAKRKLSITSRDTYLVVNDSDEEAEWNRMEADQFSEFFSLSLNYAKALSRVRKEKLVLTKYAVEQYSSVPITKLSHKINNFLKEYHQSNDTHAAGTRSLQEQINNITVQMATVQQTQLQILQTLESIKKGASP